MSKIIGVTNEDIQREKFGDLYIDSHIQNAARRIATEILKIGHAVSSFVPSNVDDEIVREFEAGRLAYIGSFYEYMTDFTKVDARNEDEVSGVVVKEEGEIVSTNSVGQKFTPNMNNAILYDEKHGVVIVACYKWKMPYYSTIDHIIFGDSIESINTYCEYVAMQSRHKYDNSVLLMTDTSNGIERKMLPKDSRFNLDDVVLVDSVKDEIIQSVRSFFEEKEGFYAKYNIPYRRGILLYGKPGNGKTTLIKAIANFIKEPAVYWQVNENTGSHSIEQVFKHVKSIAPALLVIEDIDSIPESMRSMFLNYLDGAQNNEGVFIVGTTNYPDKIDPALMNRAGRFDRAYEIKQPSEQARYSYLIRIGMGDLVGTAEVKLAASLMDGFSMSILNELYTLTALEHYYNGGKVSVERIVERLKDTQDKQKKNVWMQSERNVVGFGG